MPEEKERPRPHGDPLREEVDTPSQGREDESGEAVDETDAQRKKQYEDGADRVSRID